MLQMFQRKPSKDDLRNQVAQVTMEFQQLQHKAQDLRDVFVELENLLVTYAFVVSNPLQRFSNESD